MEFQESAVVVGVTGASGAIYGRMLVRELLKQGHPVHLIVSRAALAVISQELGVPARASGLCLEEFLGYTPPSSQITLHDDTNLTAPPASGSFRTGGMVICPCSMKTLGALASGSSATLISRAADVCLKERRRLVVVPRETPLSLIHLRNMLTLTEAGAVVLPAMPGFYHQPQTIDDLVRHVVMKIVDLLGGDANAGPIRWSGPRP